MIVSEVLYYETCLDQMYQDSLGHILYWVARATCSSEEKKHVFIRLSSILYSFFFFLKKIHTWAIHIWAINMFEPDRPSERKL